MAVAAARTGTLLAVAAAVHQVVNLRALREPPAQPPPVAEPVSVLVPARNEASRITPTIRSLLAQTGVGDLEILVLDDQSGDGTAATVRAVAAGDPRLAVLPGTPPPPGWLGKPHACAQLAAAARGRVLVFVDADVVLARHAVAAAVDLLRGAGLQMLSPWPRQLADGLGPRLVQPLLAWSWMVLLPLHRAEVSPRPSMVAANGQFMVIDAPALAAAGGFAGVSGQVLDDIALAKAMKRSGARVGVADGSSIAECRMYESWAEASAGYRKSLWSAFGSVPAAVAVGAMLAVTYLAPPAAGLLGSRAGLVGYAAGAVTRVIAARRNRGRVWPDALAHPASVCALLGLLVRSWIGHRRGTLRWKDRVL
ncbi:MAG TPA: glycosyltransferase family A protein [Pseudonocardia sp.]|nr:glycosyltransferase family A protein [Pseudonocardia sp.]